SLTRLPQPLKFRPAARQTSTLSPLESALTQSARITPLESALTIYMGGGVPTASSFQSPQPGSRLHAAPSTRRRVAPQSSTAAPPQYPRHPTPAANGCRAA